MKLVAAVTISNHTTMQMSQDQIEDFVMNSIAREISNEVKKYMEIEETKDPINDTTRYSGTISIGNGGIQPTMYSTVTNGIGSITSSSYIKKTEEFRVAEYVNKNGNIARVELQRLEEDGWTTIPRVKIEEI